MHRCYVIYDMQRWVMIFPLALFLASICKYASAGVCVSVFKSLSLSKRRASSLCTSPPSLTQICGTESP